MCIRDSVHSAIDGFSRLAYSEFAGPEGEQSCCRFIERAISFFESSGVHVERVMTDNGNGYVSRQFKAILEELGVAHTRTRPRRPATNGKVERFNRTLIEEWAYARIWRSDAARAKALDPFLDYYNHQRHHTAVGGPPVTRVNNVPGDYT